jgi:uncharacterized protein YfbU (UPF0304 family)
VAVINVRVDDHVRDALRDAAEADGISLSEYVRDLLNEAVIPVRDANDLRHGDEPAPEAMGFMDRKVLSLLHRVLARVIPEGEDDTDGDRDYQLERARVLERGFAGEYWVEAAGFATELSKRDCGRVMDILDMFRVAHYSLEALKEEGTVVDEHVATSLEYQGFDHNDALEGQMADYVQHLVDDDRWPELKPFIAKADGGNSHSRVLEMYTRMLAAYRRIMDARNRSFSRRSYLLTLDELTGVADASVHPSSRRQS